MLEKLLLLLAIVFLFVGIASIFLAREVVRKKKDIYYENVVVRNIKIVGFIVATISLMAIYFCLK